MNYRLLLLLLAATAGGAAATQPPPPSFQEAPSFRNAPSCCPNDTVHIAMTLDPSSLYLRGTFAAVLSLLRHSSCPDNLQFHFLLLPNKNRNPIRLRLLLSTFPSLRFHLLTFDPSRILPVISSSLRPALDNPLNYARFYLADLLPPDVLRVIYLDSDLLVLDDIATLWKTPLDPFLLAAPEYCHANFTSYFTREFWSGEYAGRAFAGLPRRPCYFNTGVMVIDVKRWRSGRISEKLERWMKVQKKRRIYELGSLPPMLLVFAGNVKAVEHRWNQHGLGGDNVEGNCRDLHPGPVSLLHWSGKGKPWLRLDAGQPCPMDNLWSKYDLVRRPEWAFFVD